MHRHCARFRASLLPVLLGLLCAAAPRAQSQGDPLAAFAGLEGWWSGTLESRGPRGDTLRAAALLEAHRSVDGTHAVLRFLVRRGETVAEQSDLLGFDPAGRTLYRLSLADGEEHRFDYPLTDGDAAPDPFHWVLVRTRRGYQHEDAWEYRTTDILDGDALSLLTESRKKDGAFQVVSRYTLHRCGAPRPAAWTFSDTTGTRSVAVAGDFNNWSPVLLPLRRGEADWRGGAVLPPGTYRYRLIVNGRSIPDPRNPRTEKDAHGFPASVLTVPEPER